MRSVQPPEIVAVNHRIEEAAEYTYSVQILWGFRNKSDSEIYFVFAMPIMTSISDPLILDHTNPFAGGLANINTSPPFHLVPVVPHEILMHCLTYSIHWSGYGSIEVVGRFGWGTTPDPMWESRQDWKHVSSWLEPADATPFSIKLA